MYPIKNTGNKDECQSYKKYIDAFNILDNLPDHERHKTQTLRGLLTLFICVLVSVFLVVEDYKDYPQLTQINP
jgi:hypothetical protein